MIISIGGINMERNLTMLMDYYQLSMAALYFDTGMRDTKATFDLFFRKVPDHGGYAVFSGLQSIIDYVKKFKFSKEDIEYLRSNGGFSNEFLNYLENLELKIDMHARLEGSVIFPNEPVITIKGNIIEAQIIETALLTFFNHESLIATKANRLREVVKDKLLLDFGARRAHGADAAINGARAAYIGGVDGTSNLYSGKEFNLPCGGTMAHSMIQSFDNEYDAFKAYANVFPNNCVLLVDTYNVLESGVPNAIKVLKELRERGYEGKGIRLDSGDLLNLSIEARKMLDREGFEKVKIYATNSLDEFEINRLEDGGAKIDVYGVGERLITAKSEPVFGGVYKLAAVGNNPRIKLSEDITKTTNPGEKKLYRLYRNVDNLFETDLLILNEENINEIVNHDEYNYEELLVPIFNQGNLVYNQPSIRVIKDNLIREKEKLTKEYKKLNVDKENPVMLSEKLKVLKEGLVRNYKQSETVKELVLT
jgi:nicotinate phosphoribosyltransferase